jgi:hypothetical protein
MLVQLVKWLTVRASQLSADPNAIGTFLASVEILRDFGRHGSLRSEPGRGSDRIHEED